MTPKEFVIWLKGFVQAASNYNVTPKQWDDLREMLAKVEDVDNFVMTRYTSEINGWGTNHTGGPATVSYETKSEKQLLKTEPIY